MHRRSHYNKWFLLNVSLITSIVIQLCSQISMTYDIYDIYEVSMTPTVSTTISRVCWWGKGEKRWQISYLNSSRGCASMHNVILFCLEYCLGMIVIMIRCWESFLMLSFTNLHHIKIFQRNLNNKTIFIWLYIHATLK